MARGCHCFCCRALCCRNDIGAFAAVGVVEKVGGSGSHSVCIGLYGADDACGDTLPVQGGEQLRRAGEEPGALHLEGAGLLGVQLPEAGAVFRAAVAGEDGVLVLQHHADGAAHRLPLRLGQTHFGKGVLKPGHDGLGGVAQGVVEIKKYSFVVHCVSSSAHGG